MVKAAFAVTDRKRWARNAAQSPPWDGRNILIVRHIPPNATVLDLGAGAQTIRTHLPPGCRYVPCDIVRSSPDCIVCDFNRGIYPPLDRAYDFTICSGVLEYLREPLEFLRRISAYSPSFILSYQPAEADGSDKLGRLSDGFVNHLRKEELESLLEQAGYRHEQVDTWLRQVIYRLSRV
jgi:hypothetical protein